MFLQLLSYYRYPSLSFWCHYKITIIQNFYKYYPIFNIVKTTHALSSFPSSAGHSKRFVPLSAPKSEFFACAQLQFAPVHPVSEKATGSAGLVRTPLPHFPPERQSKYKQKINIYTAHRYSGQSPNKILFSA
jgi:hypothetical protein